MVGRRYGFGNSYGRRKGIATYYKEDLFNHITDIKPENIQISKFTSSIIDVLVIYRSQNGDLLQLKENIDALVGGD